ncbi:MAG: aromatic ring-hydroxylating oxygenase subunit alpha [Steroidobacteraceae bacterium]
MHSPIPLSRFDASVANPAECRFFPPEAYTSGEFYDFELAAIWSREWIAVGRAEELPRKGDYFSVRIGSEPVLVVRPADDRIVALSPICRHRGMLVAEDSGNCGGAFVCPYHGWTYDLQGKLRAAPQMPGVQTFARTEVALPQLRVEVWQGIVFVNFDAAAAPLAPRLQALEPLLRNWRLADLRGEFLRDPNYRMQFDHAWNWKVYSEGQSECYHCDKLHRHTPIMQGLDFNSMDMDIADAAAGVWAFHIGSNVDDPTINHLGHAVLPAIGSLTPQQRRLTYAITIAPNVFMALMADSVVMLNWMPTGAASMRVKRHRLYPQSTLDLPDFAERHRPETQATREFVEQDEYAFERVQAGLRSRFAPRGPVTAREPVLVGFNRWLVDRYRLADRNARA